jgi:hypothetical protein
MAGGAGSRVGRSVVAVERSGRCRDTTLLPFETKANAIAVTLLRWPFLLVFLRARQPLIFLPAFARFLALSLALLCPIGLTFARFSTESKADDRDEPIPPVRPERQGPKVVELVKPGGFFAGAKLSQVWR